MKGMGLRMIVCVTDVLGDEPELLRDELQGFADRAPSRLRINLRYIFTF
jgi:hypothetical protein